MTAIIGHPNVSLLPGTRLGPYEILGAVGAGGMGDVYRARDPRLDRTVAIKVSREAFTERVTREARAVAALNDPHVCQIYDVGADYLVMEYVEGKPPQQAETADALLQLAIQLADGLAAAHAAGIVHRDLKPANILITKSGRAKILDFGLASAPRKAIGSEDATAADTTFTGAMAGTLAYMSPEQARAETVDARSDLWSLGIVLYELATGVHPFGGRSAAVVLEAILNRTPRPVHELNPRMPRTISDVVARLLEKDPDLRYQSAVDLRAELKRIDRDANAPSMPAGTQRRPRARVLLAMTALVVLAALAYGAWRVTRVRSPATNPSEYVQLTHFTDSATAPALSPDGRMVTFIRGGGWFLSSGQIYVKLLPNGEAVRLTNHPDQKLGPVFTPDGSRVAYTQVDDRSRPQSWDTWTVPIHGGQPSRLLANAAGLLWLGEQRVLFSEIRPPGIHMGIVTATENRAEHRPIYYPAHERGMAHYSWPSPDRRWLLIVEMERTGRWDRCRLVPFDGSSAGRLVGPDGPCIAAAWSPDGQWMYFNAEVDGGFHLWRQSFPNGAAEQITFGPNEEEGIAVAPDGRSIVTSVGLRRSSVWIHDAKGDRPLTSEGYAFAPLFSPDGRRIFYLRRQTAGSDGELWSTDLSSLAADRVLPGISILDFDISADGQLVAYTTKSPDGESQVWLASLDRKSAPRMVVRGADGVSFLKGGDLVFRSIGEKANHLERIKTDATGRQRIGDLSLLFNLGPSPDGEWMVGFVARGEQAVTVAIPLAGGVPVPICAPVCQVSWSGDGRALFISALRWMTESGGQTLVIPVPEDRALPNLPTTGIPTDADWRNVPGTQVIEGARIVPGRDAATYAFVVSDVQRNLFRIPLH